MTNYNATFLTDEELATLPFAARGKNVLIDSTVHLIGVENISIGNNVRIDAGTIIVATGPVAIGSRVHIAANCYLEGKGGIRIADFANISSYVSMHSVSDDPSGASLTNPMTPEKYKTLEMGEIVVGRHALIFAKSTILPGTLIDEGAVIGAHSLVRGTIPPWTVHAGVPSRYIKDRSRDLLALEAALLLEEGE